MAEHAHVKLSGDRTGDYVVADERPDGSLTLAPDTSAKAILDRLGHEPATLAEFEAEHGVTLPRDGEGGPAALAERRRGHAPVVFDETVWSEDLRHATRPAAMRPGRSAASSSVPARRSTSCLPATTKDRTVRDPPAASKPTYLSHSVLGVSST